MALRWRWFHKQRHKLRITVVFYCRLPIGSKNRNWALAPKISILFRYQNLFSEAAEEARLLEEQKAEEERLERERIEYEKMKADFEIEDEGEDATTEEDEKNLLKMFLDYIKENKVCYVDALASEFGLRNPDAVKRINSLMESGDLTGVLDDRGKFIYITM